MSLLYRYKPHKDTILQSVATRLDRAGVTPNQITALGLCLAFSSGLAALRGHLYTGIILFAIAAFCDALDGSVARAANRATEFGLYFGDIRSVLRAILRRRCRVRSRCAPFCFFCDWRRFHALICTGLWSDAWEGPRVHYVWEA